MLTIWPGAFQRFRFFLYPGWNYVFITAVLGDKIGPWACRQWQAWRLETLLFVLSWPVVHAAVLLAGLCAAVLLWIYRYHGNIVLCYFKAYTVGGFQYPEQGRGIFAPGDQA